jgi:hypothetical protein
VIRRGLSRPALGRGSTYPALALDALAARVGDVRACDAMEIAREVGSAKALNSVLLGVLAPLLPFPQEAWLASLEDHAPRDVLRPTAGVPVRQALRYPRRPGPGGTRGGLPQACTARRGCSGRGWR